MEWKELKEVFDTRNGYTPSTSNETFWEGGTIPWFKMEDIRDKGSILNDSYLHITDKAIKGKGLFKANSLLLATSATIGEHALIEVEHLCNQRFTNFYPKKGYENRINMRYAYYYMYIIDEWCKQHVNQGGFASVDMGGLYKLPFPIPSLPEQQRIVEQLDTFTSSIENLKEQIAQRRKQYEYYRDQLLSFEDGEIIEKLSFGKDFMLKARIGWQGLTKKEYRESGDYKLITGTDFTKYNRIDFDNCVFVDKERYDQDPYIQIQEDDVLITKDGTLGKIAYVDKLDMPATLNGGVFVVRDNSGRVLQKFLMYYLTSFYFVNWMNHNHTQGSIQHLTQALLSKFSIPVISKEKQKSIICKLDAFTDAIRNLEQQLAQREKQYEFYRNKLLTFD